MRIAMVNQFFHPDLAATAQIMTDLAVDLAARGAQVTAITGRGSYIGDRRYGPRETYKGVDIRRPLSTDLGRASIPRRMADYATFYAACAAELARLPAQDIVLTLSTPPLVSLLGAGKKYASRRHTRFVYWVQDLYPDVAVQFGLFGARSPATLAFQQLSRASLKSADAVVALSDHMASRLREKGAPADRLHVVHNWSDEELGAVAPEQNWFLDKHGLRGKFVVLYSGNMGRGHEFGTLLDAAERLKARQDIVFLFVGEGAKKREIEARAPGLPNVKLLPYQRREDLPYSLGAGDLLAISLSPGLEGMIVPSKLYGALAARKPVLFVGKGDVADILRDERCGEAFEHGDVSGVVKYVERLAANRGEAAEVGARGRKAFDEKYARRIATGRFAEICASVCGGETA